MSFYRTFIATVAALGLATSVFAADEATAPAQATDSTAQAAAPAADANAAAPQAEQININTAKAKELRKVKGLNRQQINAIISYRKAHPFKSLDELKEIKAFKKLNDEKLKAIEDQLTV